MASTYEPLATATGTGSSSSISFSSIDSQYTDLRLIAHVKQSSGYSYSIRFNGDSSTTYSNTQFWAPNGSGAWSERSSGDNQFNIGDTSTTDRIATSTLDIMGYSETSKFKTILVHHNDTGNGRAYKKIALWKSLSAIDTITLLNTSGANFTTATTFTLYGIKAA